MIKKYGFQQAKIYFSDLETYTSNSTYFKTYHDTKAYIVSSVRSRLFFDKDKMKWQLNEETNRFKKVICNANGVIGDYVEYFMNMWNIKKDKLGAHQIHYFHNGGKFDFIFVIKWLKKHAEVVFGDEVEKPIYNKLYFSVVWSDTFRKVSIIKYVKEGERKRRILLELRDSYLIFKESVKSLAQTLQKTGIEIAKGDTTEATKLVEQGQTTKEIENNKELIEYVVNDSLIVCQMFELMVDYFPKSSVLPNTIASWAKSAFLANKSSTTENATNNFRIRYMRLTKERQQDINAIFENWYVGGLSSLNERFQFKTIKNVWLEDVVSQYPHKMKDWKFPIGEYKEITNEFEWNLYYQQNKQAIENRDIVVFINYKYYNIKQNKNVPNFLKNFHVQTSIKEGRYLKYQSFLNELDLKECYFTVTMYELLCKYERREFVNAYVYENTTYLFEEHVSTFYNMKNKAKQDKEVAKEKYAKLMLNSVYGKFGEKGLRMQQVFQEILDLMNKDKIVEVKGERVIDDLGMINIVKEGNSDFSYFQVASYITSLARYWLLKRWHEIISLGGVVYYSDTDSNFFSLPDDKLQQLSFGSNLGDWELNKEMYDNFYILAPKTYVAFNKKKEIMKLACKGVDKSKVLPKGVDYFINNGTYDILDRKVVNSGIILVDNKKQVMSDKTFELIKNMSKLLS